MYINLINYQNPITTELDQKLVYHMFKNHQILRS